MGIEAILEIQSHGLEARATGFGDSFFGPRSPGFLTDATDSATLKAQSLHS